MRRAPAAVTGAAAGAHASAAAAATAAAAAASASAAAAGANAAASSAAAADVARKRRREANVYAVKTSYPALQTHGLGAGGGKAHLLELDYTDVGALWSFGDAAALKALFPGGLAGSVTDHFAAISDNALLVRPTSVFLLHHLELWRQVSGRAAAAAGVRVTDLADVRVPFTPSLPPGGGAGALPPPEDDVTPGNAKSARRVTGRIADVVAAARAAAQAAWWRGDEGWAASVQQYVAPTHVPPSTISLGKDSTELAQDAHAGGATILRNPHIWDPVARRPTPFTLLTGPNGAGKSAVLNQAVAYARSSGWLTVFLPSAFDAMNKGLVLVKSRRRPGMIDQHDVALALLQSTLAGQAATLGRLPQRGTYAKFRYLPRAMDAVVTSERNRLRTAEDEERVRRRAEAESSGRTWDPASVKSRADDESDTAVDRSTFTLRDMVEWGMLHPTQATDTLVDLLSELRQVSEVPVLIAIDGFNHLYEATPYPSEGRIVGPNELSIASALRCLSSDGFASSTHGMRRGLILSAVDQRARDTMALFTAAHVPMESRLRVPALTRLETSALLQAFARTNRFGALDKSSGVDPFAVEYFRAMSGGLPSELFRASLYLPGPQAKFQRKGHAALR